MTPIPPDGPPPRGFFPTTKWTLIRRLQEGTEEQAQAALETFCRNYWYPVYACCRHSGFTTEAAEDLTQTFFQQLIRYDTLKRVSPEKGRLRFYVRGAVKNLIANHLRHDLAAKRDAGSPLLSFSLEGAEEFYQREPDTLSDPYSLFDRAWAERVMAAAEDALASEFAMAGNLGHFEVLREFLPHKSPSCSRIEAAARLGVPDGTFRLHLHRSRKRFAFLVESEIAQTVSDPAAIREEVAYLVDLICK